MSWLKRSWILSVWLIAVLVAAGCASDGGRGDRPQTDELVLAVGSEPDGGFDPLTGWGGYGSPLFQSTLLKRDNNLDIVYDLATEYAVSEDGLRWTVKLRSDAVFSDGEPLTSDDVRFTFETAAGSGSSVDLTNLAAVETPDAHTVVFTLKQPQSTFVSKLLTLGIVPQHAYGQGYGSKPIGSGPFKLAQWDRGQQIIIERNDDYYGTKPYFKKLTFLFLGADAAYAAAKAGEVDVAYIPSSFSRHDVAGMRLQALQSVDNRGIAFPVVRAGGSSGTGAPVGNDVTADPAIRQAVNVAIDRQALVDGVLEGYGSPAYTPVDGLPWWNPDTVIADADIERARAILADAGWIDADGDGIVEQDGLKAEFLLIYPASDVTRQSLALAAADMVKQAGIHMRVEGKSWEEIGHLMHSSAVMLGWGSHDPLEMYYLYSSDFRGVDYFNTGYYSNPAVDSWMEQALAAASEEEALRYWRNAQWDGETGFSAQGDAAWAWLVNIDHLYVVAEKLNLGEQRIQPHGHGWPITDNIAEWTWRG